MEPGIWFQVRFQKRGQNCGSGSVSSFENQSGSGLVLGNPVLTAGQIPVLVVFFKKNFIPKIPYLVLKTLGSLFWFGYSFTKTEAPVLVRNLLTKIRPGSSLPNYVAAQHRLESERALLN